MLAVAVALSHVPVRVFGFNPGIVAVVSFLMMSGYVMTLLIDRHYTKLSRIPVFYVDRASRLFPQFLFYASIVLVLMRFGIPPELMSACTPTQLAENVAMLPLGYATQVGIGDCQIMPQAWSLGLELTFYLVVPWLLLAIGRSALKVVMIGSTIVFAFAVFGVLDTDQWGYRLLPGTLFIFMTGIALADEERIGKAAPRLVFVLACALLVATRLWRPLYALHYNKEVLVGLIVGIPVLALLKHRRFSAADEFLGNLSYGVFLNHNLVFWLIERYTGRPHLSHSLAMLGIVASVGLAAATHWLVERPALHLRRRIRYRPERESAERVVAVAVEGAKSGTRSRPYSLRS
jgi:peptidoglycan/LPS O-acetylase OafA/YrhL